MGSVSVLEKELTCSICTDILFDPLTFLDCLHANCGACAKSWFASQQTHAIASSSANLGKFTCPVCRSEVRATKSNPMLLSLLEDFLKYNPDKGRTPEEKREMRNLYKPGDEVLPEPPNSRTNNSMRLDLAEGMGFGTMVSPPLPSRRNGVVGVREPSYAGIFEEVLRRSRSPSLSQYEIFASALSPSALETPMWGELPMPVFPSMSNPTIPRRPAPSIPSRVNVPGTIPAHRDAEIYCDYCNKRVKFETHVHCESCNHGDFDMCMRCYRLHQGCRPDDDGSRIHDNITRRYQSGPSTQLMEGVFCHSCDNWCEGSPQRRYWQCGRCEDFPGGQHWTYCEECVNKGLCCSHDLRLLSVPVPARPARGLPASPRTMLREHSISSSFEDLVTRLERLEGISSPSPYSSTSSQQHSRLEPLHVNELILTCAICRLTILYDHSYLHCTQCLNGTYNICIRCHASSTNPPYHRPDSLIPGALSFLNSINFSPSEETYRCPENHQMQLLTQSGVPGTRSVVLDVTHSPPEYINTISGVARTAVALFAYWPEDGMQMGRWWSGVLAFPRGAEIVDVWEAFEERGEVWCWGWFAGAGGVFPRGVVRFES
ncbi:hypothetical protein RUND412_005088 [Rhizina undulata]